MTATPRPDVLFDSDMHGDARFQSSPVRSHSGDPPSQSSPEAGPSSYSSGRTAPRGGDARQSPKGKGRAVDEGLGLEDVRATGSLVVPGKARVELVYRTFLDEERDLVGIMRLCDQELSEPYVYRPLCEQTLC
jgi:hypothetical protein